MFDDDHGDDEPPAGSTVAPPWLHRGSYIFLVSSAVSLSQPDSRCPTLLQFCKNLWWRVQGHLDWLSMLCSRLLWDTQIQMLLTCWLHEILPLGFSGPTTAFLLTSSAFAGPSSSSLLSLQTILCSTPPRFFLCHLSSEAVIGYFKGAIGHYEMKRQLLTLLREALLNSIPTHPSSCFMTRDFLINV